MDSPQKKGGALGRILAVENNPGHAESLDNCLVPMGYQVLHAYDCEEALRSVEADHPDLLILDLALPQGSAYKICRGVRASQSTRPLPVIMLTGSTRRREKTQGLEAGTDDFITKPFDRVELLARVGSLLRIRQLFGEMEAVKGVLFSLVQALEAKDECTRGHSERVAQWSVLLSRWDGLAPESQENIRTAALLHDIGKLGINEAIFRKPGPLTPGERDRVCAHVTEGERICRPLRFARLLLPAIRHHHERYDGTGYPNGLRGEAIPKEARILAVADGFEAITSPRPHRPAMSREEALRELHGGAGSQWDPELVRGLVSLIGQGPDRPSLFKKPRAARHAASLLPRHAPPVRGGRDDAQPED